MPILITALLLLGAAATLAILRVLRPRFRFSWLLAITATTASWLSVFLWMPQLPLSLAVPLWQSTASSNSFASFAAGSLSWPYALSLVTLVLAVLLTAPARPNFPSPSTWALCLAVVGIGLLAAAAEGPLTLVLFWAGLDLVEAGIVLARGDNRSSSLQLTFAFTVRLSSAGLVLLALVLGSADDAGTGFTGMRGGSTLLLPAAALLRLAAFAIPWSSGARSSRFDEVATTLHLTAGASAVAFLAQLAPEAYASSVALEVACAVAALFGGWMWLRAPDAFMGRPLWIMGTCSLAVAAALRGNPIGATAWGNAMLLAGGALFLVAVNERWMNRFLLGAVWSYSALPMALTGAAWVGGGGTQDWILVAFLLAQAMLLAGYFHRALRPEIEPSSYIRVTSLRGIYRAGIALPVVVGLLLGLGGWPGAMQLGVPFAAGIVLLLAAALAWAMLRFASLSPVPTLWIPTAWGRFLAVAELETSRLQEGIRRGSATITRTIEGEAGILWSLLLLVLFVSLLVERGQ